MIKKKRKMSRFSTIMLNTWKLIRYNMRIIFGGRFVYFVLTSFIFFLIIGALWAFDANEATMGGLYKLMIFPAVLLVFYPTAYAIQNDADQRTLEIIFGIPDYRYKVWLFRFVIIILLTFILLFPFAGVAYWTILSFPVLKMILQLMVVVLFAATLSFAVSTIVKNGNATSVVMVILSLILMIIGDELTSSKWNVLFNPFEQSIDSDILFQETLRQNRLFMLLSSVVFLLIGLLNLQKREKFLR